MNIRRGIIYNFPENELWENLAMNTEKLDYAYTAFGDTPDIFLLDHEMILICPCTSPPFPFKSKAMIYALKEFGVECLIILSPGLLKDELKPLIPKKLILADSDKESFFEGHYIPPLQNVRVCPTISSFFSKRGIEKRGTWKSSRNLGDGDLLSLNDSSGFFNSGVVSMLSLATELQICTLPIFFTGDMLKDVKKQSFFKAAAEIISGFFDFPDDNECRCSDETKALIKNGYIYANYKEITL